MKFPSLKDFWWIPFLLLSRQEELCGSLNSRTIYLQLGEHDSIILQNQTWFNRNVLRCSTELVTCPSCSIEISVVNLNLPQTCDPTVLINRTVTGNCQCGGLAIWEPTANSPPFHLCSAAKEITFSSSTRSVGVSLDYIPTNWTGEFIIQFIAKKNLNVINSSVDDYGHVNSPNFPSLYPRDFGIEHIFNCASNNCIVSLMFTDFLISTSSIMEFYDWDGQPILLVSGLLARPRPIVSTGPSLSMRFFGNGGTGLGYKASYQFLENTTILKNVSTECGGEVDSLGGTIYMTGLSGSYDCVWFIQPAPSISHFKTHVYIKVVQYSGGELILRQGQTSEDRLLETFSEHHFKSIEHVAPISKGFYLSYKGNLSSTDKLIIAYSTFAYMDCLTGTDLLCENKRCVSITLMCDSFDNCGDNSDEINCKPEVLQQKEVQYWWPYRNNGINTETGAGGALLALGAALAGSAVLLAVTLCRVALRMRSPPSSHAPHHIDHIRTIAHLLNIGEMDERDEPPIYEPPPEYSQVVKPARPRRKHSTQRLIDRDTPTQEGETSVEKESQMPEIKNQLLNIPRGQTSSEMDAETVRLTNDTSQPASLETTGYNEDLGMSLTVSMSSQKGMVPDSYIQWPLPNNNHSVANNLNTVAVDSMLSFDTLYSSGQEFPSQSRQLIKSHSQDNILRLRTESATKRTRESSSSCFDSYTFGNQTIQIESKVFQPASTSSLDDIDIVNNCFSSPREIQNASDAHSQ